MTRRRLDVELVRRGLAPSRTAAQDLIGAGLVLVSGSRATKPARLVDGGEPVVVTAPPRQFVSRGGEKLDGALDRFGVECRGVNALDAGASTGGFTGALLQRGAQRVVAVDVGTHQLHESLRADARVVSLEQTDIRSIGAADVGGPFDLVVADLSFIPVHRFAPSLARLVDAAHGLAVVLIKPQFEAGRADVSRGRGVITDPDIWRSTLAAALDSLALAGLRADDLCASPIRGRQGNAEFLVLCHLDGRGADDRAAGDAVPEDGSWDALIAAVIDSM